MRTKDSRFANPRTGLRISASWRPAAALLAALVFAACFGCRREEPVAQPEPPRPVRYVKTYAVGGARVRTFSGAAKAGMAINLSFKVQGTLSALNALIGDTIRKGQLIAEIDATDYEIQVGRVEASLAQAKAQAAAAGADFERVRNLYERKNVPQSDYDAALGRTESAQANVRAMEKQLEQAKLQVDYCKLYSPVAGSVAEVPVEVNENVRAGQPIVVLNAGAPPEVEVAIPEILIAAIRRGAPVRGVAFDAIPERTFTGTITEVAIVPPQGLTTYPVTVQLHNDDSRILPGMAAEVSFALGSEGQPALHILPPHAVGEDREGRFVFVVKPAEGGVGTIERRGVEVGRLTPSDRFGDGLEIVSGLADGEMVVTAGISKITSGQQVSISEDSAG